MRFLVVCGLLETMAIFSPTSAFVSVDFPTFGRPAIVIMADFVFIGMFSLLPRQLNLSQNCLFACAHLALHGTLVDVVIAQQVQNQE